MFIAKLIPSRVFSIQARRPSGWLGRHVMSRLFSKGNADLNDFVKDLLELKDDDKVLEIGFGPGTLINHMASITTRGIVEGIDFSEEMFIRASKTNREHISHERVKLRVGNCNNLPYEDESFNKVCTSNTIYFWDDPDKNLSEIFRVIRKGGRFVAGFRDKDQMKNLPLSKDVFNLYSQNDVKELLVHAGFSDVRIENREGAPFVSYCAVAVKA